MKKILILGIGLLLLTGLAACGSNEYEDEITAVVNDFKEAHGSFADKVTRDNSTILVYDDGKYISIANKIDGRVIDSYYQKASGTKDQLKLVTNLDTEDYIKKDAKLNYEEKNGKEVKQ